MGEDQILLEMEIDELERQIKKHNKISWILGLAFCLIFIFLQKLRNSPFSMLIMVIVLMAWMMFGYALQRKKKKLQDHKNQLQQMQNEYVDSNVLGLSESTSGVLKYSLFGARGRSLFVYEDKCVLKTDVTIGSLITKNATDGVKTIYYSDVKL